MELLMLPRVFWKLCVLLLVDEYDAVFEKYVSWGPRVDGCELNVLVLKVQAVSLMLMLTHGTCTHVCTHPSAYIRTIVLYIYSYTHVWVSMRTWGTVAHITYYATHARLYIQGAHYVLLRDACTVKIWNGYGRPLDRSVCILSVAYASLRGVVHPSKEG